MHKILQSFVALSAVFGTTTAQAACWSQPEVAAAKVKQLDTMLVVSALRCRNSQSDFMSSYNRFATRHRGNLAVASVMLQKHFGSAHAFDHYIISGANRYGAGVEGMSCADLATIARTATEEQSTLEAVANLAERSGVDPMLDGAMCEGVARR